MQLRKWRCPGLHCLHGDCRPEVRRQQRRRSCRNLRLVAERVVRTKQAGHDVVVVVSAMGDTTDELLGMAKQISAAPDRRELDMLLTAGERISMALLSMAIRELGGDAISFTGSQSGIITNDRHVDARIIEVRPYRVQDELARGKIVVVAGFQGVSYRREVTTLGRGGSDTTAVAMAAALDAEYCEICSDVDGVYSADPRVVTGGTAHRHALLRGNAGDGRVGREGPERTGRRIRQGARHRDLRARDERSPCRAPIRPPMALLSERIRLACRAPSSASRANETCSWSNRMRAPRACSLPSTSITWPASSCTCLPTLLTPRSSISRENLHDAEGVQRAMHARFGDRVTFISGLGAVSAIGAGINATYANVRAGLSVLRDADIQCRGISTSSFRITWMVPDADVDRASRALHARFIESAAPRVP